MMDITSENRSPTDTPTCAAADRRKEPRIALAIHGLVVLAGDTRVPCTVHDVSEHGIGISIDPEAVTERGDTRLRVRCGDNVTLCFRVPGAQHIMRAGVKVRRVWCCNGTVEMGLDVRRVNREALQLLARVAERQSRRAPDRRRTMKPSDLDVTLRRIAAETFPRIAGRLETSANDVTRSDTGTVFRALVRIETGRDDIAERFVTLARRRLMPELHESAPSDRPQPLQFDHVALADAFTQACELKESDSHVRDVVQALIVASGFRRLAPSLPTASL